MRRDRIKETKRKMKSKKGIGFLVLCTMFVCTASAGAVTMTIATFDDPAVNSTTPLFTIDLTNDRITGGWSDLQTGLDLNVVYSHHTFLDAFFEMTLVTYTGGLTGGSTGSGTIKFFADNQSTSTTPLIRLDFDSANLSPMGFGGLELFALNDVTISGSEIGGATLTDEAFSFSFANQVILPIDDGYTATAAFTSSAVPEPATIVLLGLGTVALLYKKKRQPTSGDKL